MLCHRNSHEGHATGEALAVCAIQPFDHATLLATPGQHRLTVHLL